MSNRSKSRTWLAAGGGVGKIFRLGGGGGGLLSRWMTEPDGPGV